MHTAFSTHIQTLYWDISLRNADARDLAYFRIFWIFCSKTIASSRVMYGQPLSAVLRIQTDLNPVTKSEDSRFLPVYSMNLGTGIFSIIRALKRKDKVEG